VQVADRGHLMENASHAFLDAVRKSMRQIRTAIGAARSILPCLPPPRSCNMTATDSLILAMAKEGATIKGTVRRADYGRGLVRKVLRGQRSQIFRVRSSSLGKRRRRDIRPRWGLIPKPVEVSAQSSALL
jgi:hypothetical protein